MPEQCWVKIFLVSHVQYCQVAGVEAKESSEEYDDDGDEPASFLWD